MQKNNISAEVVAHSLSPQGEELLSMLVTFPRIILAEVNTHRMLSKNTSSSRAIPFLKMVETVKTNPFIPIAWQKAHSGMQGSEYLIEKRDTSMAIQKWLRTRDLVIEQAEFLNNSVQITKQLTNRLLEPFMWTTMLITGSKSGWDNFFRLRCPQYTLNNDDIFKSKKDFKSFYKEATEVVENHSALPLFAEDADNIAWLKANKGQAEIHIMDLAEKIWDARNESTPKQLKAGEWHIPFEDKMGRVDLGPGMHIQSLSAQLHTVMVRKIKISVAMGARTSYTTIGEEKEINPETLIGLHDRLLTWDPPHSSPFEHCARAMHDEEYTEFVKGTRTTNCNVSWRVNPSNGWCYNLKGFIPYRYLVDNSLTL